MVIIPRRKRLGMIGPDSRAPQKTGKQDWDFDRLGLGSPERTGVSYEHLISIQDQRTTSSCVGQAWEQSLFIEGQLLGYGPEFGSVLYGYFNARMYHGATGVDRGTYLRSYANGLRTAGRCRESDWKFSTWGWKVNKRPPPRVYQKAHGFRGIKGHYRIFDMGIHRIDPIISALENGKCVVIGMRIDQPFTENEGPNILGIPSGKFIGGHAMVIVGYTITETGRLLFRVANSWGTDWRDGGLVWFDEELITWHGITDVWVGSLR